MRCERALGGSRLSPVLLADVEVLSVAPYDGVARRVVAAMKFGGRIALAPEAARAMARAQRGAGWTADVLAPVPASERRSRARGFDVSLELTRALHALTGVPYVPLLRRADGPRQVGRSRRDRLADPPRVWCAGRVPASRVLLVDDVLTTGATLTACADALLAGGAAGVRALTLARAGEVGRIAAAA